MLKYNQYTPPSSSLWQGRADSLPNERFYQQTTCINLIEHSLPQNKNSIIVGFSSDEGVRRNLGRMGAKDGPDSLRKQFAKLCNHQKEKLIDIGNIECIDGDLEGAQQSFTKLIDHCHKQGHRTIALGGGHEIAWPHFHGLAQNYPKLGIINIDAHFDLRPIVNSKGSSGTPFTQIKSYCDTHDYPFEYCCLGIQPAANPASLFQRAEQWKVRYLLAEQVQQESTAFNLRFLDDFLKNHHYLYLTICLDVFDACYAPGVSAPQALGLNPWDVLYLLKYIKQTGKVVGLDIAELSPPLDEFDKTARLGAMLLSELMNKGTDQ